MSEPVADEGAERTTSGYILDEALSGDAAKDCPVCVGTGAVYIELASEPGADKDVERTDLSDILNEVLGGNAAEDRPGRGGGGGGCTSRWRSYFELASETGADESVDWTALGNILDEMLRGSATEDRPGWGSGTVSWQARPERTSMMGQGT